MNELPYIDSPEVLVRELNNLINVREGNKTKKKRTGLSKQTRQLILDKTDSKCHICGKEVSLDKFEADHVKNFTSGGEDNEANFLASCRTCNNYRWHYSPQEVQWILKIGVWAKTQMAKETSIGRVMAEQFVKSEVSRENRRKVKRESL